MSVVHEVVFLQQNISLLIPKTKKIWGFTNLRRSSKIAKHVLKTANINSLHHKTLNQHAPLFDFDTNLLDGCVRVMKRKCYDGSRHLPA